MANVVWTPSAVTSYSTLNTYDVVWSTDTTVSLTAGHGGKVRNISVGTAFDAIHDGCEITDITVEFTGHQVSFTDLVSAYADFGGVVSVLTSGLAHSSTNYSASGGSGTLPSVVRAAELTSSCHDNDASLAASVKMSLPTVTVTYTDNGVPHSIFFGANF